MPNNAESTGPKVVHLDPDTDRMTRVKLARLPAAVEAVRELCQRRFLARLKTYFERADDSLFDLADKASSNEEQNLYFDSMREVRVRRHGIETNFCRSIDEAFGELVHSQAQFSGDVYDSLKADALSLVHDDDLEALVAVDSSVARANSEFGEAIQYISLRLDSLMPVKVYQKNNPVGPDVVCAAFMSEVKKLDVNIKAKLVLFRLFDKFVIAGLGEIYDQVNSLLIENNVMPSLPSRAGRAQQMRRRASDRQAPSASQNGVEQAEQITPAMQQAMSAATTTHVTPEVAATLTRLFGDQVIADGSVHVAPEELAANQLVQLLNAAQRIPQQSNAVIRGKDIRAVVAKMRDGVAGSQIGRVEDQVMNLVNMLFDFILEDRNLPSTMKMLISRMQIPIIKVALADKTFFTKKGHVARKLLNEMSTAAIGWQGDENSAEKDPLYRKIDQIVRTLLTDFDTDVSIFNDLLAEFTSFLEKERKRIAVLERRTVDAEDGKAKAEIARQTVAVEIEVRVVELELPEAIGKLVNEAWSNVLFVTALKYGYGSDEWKGMLATLDELLWSLQQPRNAEHRQKLIKSVPALLKKLRAGLDTISYNPFEMSALFKALEAVHLDCIRGKSPVVRKSENVSPVSAPESLVEPRAEEVQASDAENSNPASSVEKTAVKQKVAKAASEAVEEITMEGLSPFSSSAMSDSLAKANEEKPTDEVDAVLLQQVESFVQGAWFDMDLGEGSVRCRLAAFIKPTGKYIFVNRNGMKVAEKTQIDLARMLQKSGLRVLDNSMLFDRALETIVSGLRKTRPAQ